MSKHGMLITVVGDQEGADPRIVTENDPLPVHISGVKNSIVNELFHVHTAVNSTLAVASLAGDVTIQLADATGFLANDHIQINNGHRETTYPQIISIATNTLTLDRPLDYAYDIGDGVEVIHSDIKTDVGSLVAPVSHKLEPEPGTIWHIERLIISMTHNSAATDDKFGNLTALQNGVLIRANIDGQIFTFTNWKTNRDIWLDMYDVAYTDKAGSSLFGTHARGSFSRIGVTIRLDGNKGDYLEVLNQDDLTGLSSFLVNGQGHFGR